MRERWNKFVVLVKKRPVFLLLLVLLFFLPFLDGGTHFAAETLLLILPLPFFLLGLSSKELKLERVPNWLLILWLIFLVFVGLSVVNSTNLLFSLPAYFQLLTVFLFFLLFLSVLKKGDLVSIFGLILTTSFFLCFLSFYYLLPTVGKPTGMNLVYATYGHSHLADYLLLVIPFVLALLITSQKKKSFFASLLIFYLVCFVLTFSRGAFLILPLVVLLMVFLVKPQSSLKKLLSWLLILIPLGLLLLVLFFSLSSFGVKAMRFQPDHWLVKQLVKPEFQAKRLDYWQQALEGFKERPFFGFGWGTFEIVALRFQRETAGWSNYAHNFYLQVLSEAGILALFSFLIFLLLSFRLIWRLLMRNKNNSFLLGGFGAILASSLHSLVDYDWHFPGVFLTFLFILAGLFALQSRDFKKKRRDRIKKCLLGSLALLIFVFGWIQIADEYFYQKGDYLKAITFSPWPPVRARKIGREIFEINFEQGERVGQWLIALSPGDPSMHYWLGDRYFFHNDYKKAAEHYQKAIFFNPLGNYRLYQRLVGLYVNLNNQEEKETIYQFFFQELKKTRAYLKENPGLAKTLYFIGEEYLSQGKNEKAIKWWAMTPTAAPDWSFFPIETASLYLELNETEKAKDVLKNCLVNENPREHCQEYFDKLSANQNFEPPGFWRDEIVAIPGN